MTRVSKGDLNASSRRESANLLQKRLRMADVVDDRLVGNVVDVLHVITRLGSIGHLLPVSVVDSLKNIDATRGHLLRNTHYR